MEITTPKKHFHCKVIAYRGKSQAVPGALDEATEIDLIGYVSEEDAIARAKKLIDRPGYFLRNIWQCNHCDMQEMAMKAQAEMLKHLKKHNDEDGE